MSRDDAVTAQPGRAGRTPLMVDLDAGVMQAGQVRRRLEPGAQRSEVLSGYLAMVRAARSAPVGAPVSLRVGDIEVLSGALRMDPGEVTTTLEALMGSASAAAEPKVIRPARSAGTSQGGRWLLVGLVAAVVAAAAALGVWASSDGDPATTTTIPTTTPATTAAPTTGAPSATTVPVTGLPPAPTASIGEPAVVERNP